MDLLRLIANQVGFKYVLEYEGKYGAMDYESGEWNGVVRELMENVRNVVHNFILNRL